MAALEKENYWAVCGLILETSGPWAVRFRGVHGL